MQDVNNDAEVYEDLLGFLKLEKMEAQSNIEVIIPSLQRWDQDVTFPVAQGYNIAHVMG